jgi:hypothetical protein
MRDRPYVFLILVVFVLVSFSYNGFAEIDGSIPAQFRKTIELRRGTWTGLKAEIEIKFTSAKGKEASCQGTLTYHRLDEKILLQCYGVKNRRVFALRTTDREFELYLPGHKTLYKGSIFTLEDSPAIESHLRAWDLYRSFKPMVIPSENVEVSAAEEGLTLLTIFRGEPPAKAREVKVSPEGDIVSEVYYAFGGGISLEIKRSEFQTIGAEIEGVPTAYPRKIQILSHKLTSMEDSTMETIFLFKSADFLTELSEADFEMPLPSNTKIMELEDDLAS